MKGLVCVLSCFSILISGCSQQEAPPPSAPQSTETSAKEMPEPRPKFAEVEMVNSKRKQIAKVVLQQVVGGVKFSFESDQLSKKRYRFTVEESCRETKRSTASGAFKKTIKELNVNRSVFQDEVRLKGYSLEDESAQSLDGKVVKLYEFDKKEFRKRHLACGRIVMK